VAWTSACGVWFCKHEPPQAEACATHSSQSEQSFCVPTEDAVHVTLWQSRLADVIHAQLECAVAPERIIRPEQEVIRAEGLLSAPERRRMGAQGSDGFPTRVKCCQLSALTC
jgi:hypothetical protein